MKLDPQQQVLLLELATTQRLHESSGKAPESPEQAELTKATNVLARQRSATHAAQRAVDDMEREILRIQADEARLRSRIADNKKQLMAATDPSTRKDLNKDLYTTKSRLNDLLRPGQPTTRRCRTSIRRRPGCERRRASRSHRRRPGTPHGRNPPEPTGRRRCRIRCPTQRKLRGRGRLQWAQLRRLLHHPARR